jgi:thiamine pyrophosphate-dependent acetolactate synthase large subunit-like protein
MKKEAALAVLAAARGPRDLVVTTMGVSMPWARLSQSPLDFHSVDAAMGHTADFALGLALARPDRRVLALNGDGSMLMCLETLVTAVECAAPNYILVVFANRTYEVTGNQPVPAASAVDFVALARAAGFREAHGFAEEAALAVGWPKILAATGPVFVALEVEPGGEPPPSRKEPLSQDCVRVRTLLRYEDNPAAGEFAGFDPAAFAAANRCEIVPRRG